MHVRRLVVKLSFTGQEPDEIASTMTTGRRYRPGRSHARRGVVARLVTVKPGLYRVSYEDLFGSKRRRGVRLGALRLSRQGRDVAFHVDPPGEKFRPGSLVYFWSDGADENPYGTEAVYELELGASGVRMQARDAAPWGPRTEFFWQHDEYEQNRLYQSALVDAEDLWLWDALVSPAVKEFPFTLEALEPAVAGARLTVHVQGGSDFFASPDHHLRIIGRLNAGYPWARCLHPRLRKSAWPGTRPPPLRGRGDHPRESA